MADKNINELSQIEALDDEALLCGVGGLRDAGGVRG